MPLSCAPVSTMYRGVVSSSSFPNLSFVPKESPSEHFSVLITQSSGAIWATAWVSCASKAKPPSIKVISPWDVKSGFPGISWECGWRAWNIILLSESLSTGGGWSPGIRLSFTDNIDQEWTGLITGAERRKHGAQLYQDIFLTYLIGLMLLFYCIIEDDVTIIKGIVFSKSKLIMMLARIKLIYFKRDMGKNLPRRSRNLE